MTVHFYAEKSVDVFDFAAIPGYFDGVANGALHLGRAGVELFGNFGIEPLGYRIDNVGIFHRHFNGFAQKLIAFYVRGMPTVIKILDIFSSISVFFGRAGIAVPFFSSATR